jgi:hypothetical protein
MAWVPMRFDGMTGHDIKPSSTLGQSVMQGKLWDFTRPSLSVLLDFNRGLVGGNGTLSTPLLPP